MPSGAGHDLPGVTNAQSPSRHPSDITFSTLKGQVPMRFRHWRGFGGWGFNRGFGHRFYDYDYAWRPRRWLYWDDWDDCDDWY